MNYFREQQLPTYLDRWMEYEKDRQYGRMAIVGLAVYLNSIPDSLAQLKRALTPSANGNVTGGVNLYSYASTNTLDSNGIVTTPNSTFYGAIGDYFGGIAPVPELPWKSKPERGHVYGWIRVDDGPAFAKDGGAVFVEADHCTDSLLRLFTSSDRFCVRAA